MFFDSKFAGIKKINPMTKMLTYLLRGLMIGGAVGAKLGLILSTQSADSWLLMSKLMIVGICASIPVSISLSLMDKDAHRPVDQLQSRLTE